MKQIESGQNAYSKLSRKHATVISGNRGEI